MSDDTLPISLQGVLHFEPFGTAGVEVGFARCRKATNTNRCKSQTLRWGRRELSVRFTMDHANRLPVVSVRILPFS